MSEVSPRKKIQELIVKEIGIEGRRRLVEDCKALGIDLGDGRTIQKLADKNEILFTLISWGNFGILSKITKIKKELE